MWTALGTCLANSIWYSTSSGLHLTKTCGHLPSLGSLPGLDRAAESMWGTRRQTSVTQPSQMKPSSVLVDLFANHRPLCECGHAPPSPAHISGSTQSMGGLMKKTQRCVVLGYCIFGVVFNASRVNWYNQKVILFLISSQWSQGIYSFTF